jgi:3-dehydroquinate dehydratase-1
MSRKINWHQAPLLVGTLTTSRGLNLLAKPLPDADLVEVRLDALLAEGADLEKILDALHARKHPVLLTLRLPAEGGLYPWATGERAALYTALLPEVEAIDIELASAQELQSVLKLARRHRVAIILSAQSIVRPVSPATLQSWAHRLLRLKPTIAKIATHLNNRADLVRLATLLLTKPQQRWALMGMGPTGALSRVVLGALGSALVYGYLDRPAAPGQPSIKKLATLKTGKTL